jgi:cytochrome c556
MLKFGIGLFAVLLCTDVVVAQQDLTEARDALMKSNAKQMYGVLNRMVREQKPFDQAAVDQALQQLIDDNKTLSALFPDSSKDLPEKGDYGSSSKIWENKADFEAKITALEKTLSDNKGKITSLDELKAVYPSLNGACTDCHETYRVKKG